MIKLTRLHYRNPVWINPRNIAWLEASGEGSWLKVVGDGEDGWSMRETPEQILALINPPREWELATPLPVERVDPYLQTR